MNATVPNPIAELAYSSSNSALYPWTLKFHVQNVRVRDIVFLEILGSSTYVDDSTVHINSINLNWLTEACGI